MNRDDVLVELADIVRELTEGRTHVEPILDDNGHGRKTLRRAWTTEQPALLDQLRTMAHEGLRVGARPPGSVGKPSSRPPGNFEALAVAATITYGAKQWERSYGYSTETPLRTLVGIAPGIPDAEIMDLLREARYWRSMASTATGWTDAPWAPAVPCPMCDRFGSLRVDVDRYAAYCNNRDRDTDGTLSCGAAWPEGTAGPLFVHIRTALEGRAA